MTRRTLPEPTNIQIPCSTCLGNGTCAVYRALDGATVEQLPAGWRLVRLSLSVIGYVCSDDCAAARTDKDR